jgi:hypothetical protein
VDTYNPDRPYVVGQQWPPLLADQVLLDPSIEVGYPFRAGHKPDDLDLRSVQLFLQATPGQPTRKQLTAQVYSDGEPALIGPARTLLIPCTTSTAVAGATAGGGAATFKDAVVNPSDAGHVIVTGPNAAIRFWFGTAAAEVQTKLDYQRILDVSVVYAISGPFDQYPGAVTIGLERPSANVNWVMDDTVTGPASQAAGTVIRRARLGELNPWWSPTQTPAQTAWRFPWSADSRTWSPTPMAGLDSMSASGGTNINVRIGTSASVPAGTVFQIHYVALEVTYGQENRVGAGGLDISGGIGLLPDGTSYLDIPLIQVEYNLGYLPGLTPGSPYAVTIGQAYSGSLSVASPVPVALDRLGSTEPFRGLEGVVVRKTLRPGAAPTLERTEMMPPIALMRVGNQVDPGSHVYRSRAVGNAHSSLGLAAVLQRIIDTDAGTYPWVKFYARCQETTRDPLRVGRITPTGATDVLWAEFGEVSVDEFHELPDLGNGWREVLVRLNAPVQLTGSGNPVEIAFKSMAGAEAAWHILGADQNVLSVATAAASLATYQGETGYGKPNVIDLSSDLTVMLLRDMDLVSGLTVTPDVQELAVVDEACGRPTGTVPTGILFHRLEWEPINSEMVSGWGHYEVQRQDDTMSSDEWETIAAIRWPQVTTIDDYEARVGVPTRYRVRTVHRAGLAGPWTTAAPVEIPAPGVTGVSGDAGVLILTSNHDPDANAAYVMSWGGDPVEEFTFGEASQVEWRDMFGRDFRTAHRPLERGGVEFTRTVLVNAVAVAPKALDRGFRALRDLAWDTVPYVCVRDELASRWLSAIVVPSGTVRRRPSGGQLQLAQMTVVETTGTPAPVAGGDPPCEGLRPEGRAVQVGAVAPARPSTFQTVIAQDTFTRVVADGWGSMESPALAWQRTAGRAERANVTGSVGRMVIADWRNANPMFNANAASWTPFGGTIGWQQAQVFEGSGAALLTPDGVTATTRMESDYATGVSPGDSWRAAARVRCPVARTVMISINWFDAANVYLSTATASAVTLVANTWTRISTAAAAPANAARASVNVQMTGTPPVTHLLYVDEAYISPQTGEIRMVTANPVGSADVAVRVKARITAAPAGTNQKVGLFFRRVDGSNYYRGNLTFATDGTLKVNLERIVNATVTMSTTEVPVKVYGANGYEPVNWTVGTWYWLQVRAVGDVLQVGAWLDGHRPYQTLGTVTDTAFPAAGRVGVAAGPPDANTTNSALAFEVDTFEVFRSPAELDLRLQFRPTGDDPWWFSFRHYGTYGTNMSSSGWWLNVGSDQVRADVYDTNYFYWEVPTADLKVVTGQRQWLRWVHRTKSDVAGQSRADLYRSTDGVTWELMRTVTDDAEPPASDWGEFGITLSGPVTLMRAELRGGVDGPVLISPDFEAQPSGTTQFVDALGYEWKVDGRGICAG